MLSSLNFLIVVSVAEACKCIKQALLNWAQKNHQLLSIIITEEDERPCYKDTLIHTAFCNHLK